MDAILSKRTAQKTVALAIEVIKLIKERKNYIGVDYEEE
jgi:hypothetical protein